MPTLPAKKVGLISCSGEELAEGTLARMATLRVLETLSPNDTVTLCLPLFLAGDDKERTFARFYPTIAIDGCHQRCAARATEKYSAPPAASIVVPDVLAACQLTLGPSARHQGDVASEAATHAGRTRNRTPCARDSRPDTGDRRRAGRGCQPKRAGHL